MITGVQQIMLGSVCKNEASAKDALQRIKGAGCAGVELNRFMIHPSGLLVRMLTKAAGMPAGNGGKLPWLQLIRESGLKVISLHTDLGSLEKETKAQAEEAKSFGTDKLVITGMYRFDYTDAAEVKKLACRLNAAGKALADEGIDLLYHNHSAELLSVSSGVKAYDIILQETDPDLVGFEFDSYWFTDAGADASGWMKKLGSRMKLWHIADRGFRQSGPAMTPILKADSVELGTGNMDLNALYLAAKANGVRAAVLESHRNWIDKDPLKSIELSAKWLNTRCKDE